MDGASAIWREPIWPVVLVFCRFGRRDVTSGEYLAWCDEIMKHATDAGAQVIVNDRTDIATVAGAAGVHLGQSDLSPDMARRVVPTTMMLGLSTHTRAQLDGSTTVAVDYVAVGPVYRTDTKDTGYAAVGLDLVTYAARLRPARPVVAIGGITLDRVESIIVGGCDHRRRDFRLADRQ